MNMGKQIRMTSILLLALIFCIPCMGQKKKLDTGTAEYLKKVWEKLDEVSSATYYEDVKAWEPGDTIPVVAERLFCKEYTNPKDTTIGSSFVILKGTDTTRFEFGYNGEVNVTTYHDKKGIMIDDFTHRDLPFRLVSPPFFNYTKSIVNYILETTDSISTDLKEFDDYRYLKLVIHEDRQVEFFGKAYYIPKPPFNFGDPTSVYELWIGKSDDLPYKYRREMSHSISSSDCVDAELNKISISDFDLFSYFPEGYEIRQYGEVRDTMQKSDLVGKKAPDWVLKDANEKTVSLSDFDKSKVLVIQLTGIGCGPCMASIPFLNKLKKDYNTEDVEVVAIETWVRKGHALQNYVGRHKIGYTFLAANDDVVEAFQTGRAVPFFFILDGQRIIRKVIQGYSADTTDEEIIGVINELLSK